MVVAPVRIGGGTRLKILEALAHRKALVSTTFAASGIDLVSGKEIVFADDPTEIAAAINGLFESPQRRLALGNAGYDKVAQRYSWTLIGQSFAEACA